MHFIGAIVGAALLGWIITALIGLAMRGNLRGEPPASEGYAKRKNSNYYLASYLAATLVVCSGIVGFLERGSMDALAGSLIGAGLVVWEFWRRPRV